jgi:hypothetical protein
VRAAHVADIGDRRAAILRGPGHTPASHDELALAVNAPCARSSRLIGEYPWKQREVARAVPDLTGLYAQDELIEPWLQTDQPPPDRGSVAVSEATTRLTSSPSAKVRKTGSPVSIARLADAVDSSAIIIS